MNHDYSHSWSNLFIISVFFLTFGDAFGSYLIGSYYRMIIALICIVFFILAIPDFKIEEKQPINVIPRNYTLIAFILCVISFNFWYSTYNIYSYLGIPIAYLVYVLDKKITIKIIECILYISLILVAYEYFSEKYLFVSVKNGLELDEKLLGGATGVFRAKGIMSSPLPLGVFCILAYFLSPNNYINLIIGIIICFFANSRTGIAILCITACYIYFKRINIKWIIIVLILVILIYYSVDYLSPAMKTSFYRIGLLGEGSSQQTARIYYWTNGLLAFINSSAEHLIFGNNGYYHHLYNNNPESGWICLLTDNGILGFLFYFIPLLYCTFIFFKTKQYTLLGITLLFILLNFIITSNLSGTSNLLYWLLTFDLVNRAVYGQGKIGPAYIE